MKRKLLSVLLCLSMVLTFLPSAALAEGSEELTEAQAAMQAFKESYDASSGSVNRTAIFNAVISYDPNVAELKEYYSSIKTLDLSNFGLEDTGLLVPFSGLTNLNLSGNSITSPDLTFCPELVTLDLSSNNGLSSINGLAKCTKLTKLNLSGATSLSDINALANCTGLTTLNLSGAESLGNVNALASCTGLATLDLSGATNLSSITALASCTNLTTLDLSGAASLTNIGALESCTKLATLDLSGTGISNIGALADCTALKDVNLSGTSLSDFAALANKQITKLDISKTNADSSSSYGALVNLPLEELNLSGNAKIAVIGPLTTAGNSPACANTLKTLDISGTGMTTLGLWNSQASTPGPSLPNLTTLTAQNLNLTDLGDLAAIAQSSDKKLTKVNLTGSTLTPSNAHTDQVNAVNQAFSNNGLSYTEPAKTAVDTAVEQKDAFKTALGEDNGKEKLTWEILSNAIKWYKDALAYVESLKTARAAEDTVDTQMKALTDYYAGIKALDMSGKDAGTIQTSVLEPFTGLETLNLSNTNITEIEGLAECTSLKVLDVSGNDIADISALEKCNGSLEELNLSGNERVKDLRALDDASSLKTLDVSNTGIGTAVAVPDGATSKEIDSLEALSGLSLTSLDISGNAGITDISSLTTTTDDSTHAETASELSKNLASLNISGTGVTDLSSMWKVDADDTTSEGEAAFSKLTTLNAEGLTLESITNLSKVAEAMNKTASASGSGSTETVTLNLKDSTLKADEDVAKEIEAITEALKDAATEDGAGFTAPTVNDTGMSDLDVAKAAKDELAKKLSSGVLTCEWDDLFTAVLAYNKVNDSETDKAELTTWYANISKIDLSGKSIANSMYGGIGADVGVLAPFTGLTELDLSNTDITDKVGSDGKITTAALGALANMPNLKVLDVSGNPGIIDIGALQNTKLTKLNASNTRIDDEDLGALVGLSLADLDLSHTGITDIGGLTNPGKDASGNSVMNQIADSLVRLDISATGVTALQSVWDADKQAAAFPKLGTLTATGLQLDSISGLAQIAKTLNAPITVRWDLKDCDLKSTLANVDAVNIITDKLGEAAETGSGFVAPNVDEPNTTKLDKAVKWAKRFDAAMGNENGDGGAENLTWDTLITAVYFYKEAVKEVESSGNAADKAQLDNLTQHYASITTLNMSGKNMSKFAISTGALTPFTGLKNLYLADSGIKEIGGLEGLKDLETLDISNNNLTDSGSTKILGALKDHTKLVNLDASDNPNLSDLGALATCTGLKTLNLSNTGTADSSLGALVGLDLVKLDLSGTQITDVGGLTSNGKDASGNPVANKITGTLTTLDISNTKVTKLESVWDATNSKPAFPQLTDLTAKNLVLSSFTGLVNIVTQPSFTAANQKWIFTDTTLVPAEGGPTSEEIKQHIDAINNAFNGTTNALVDFPTASNVHEHVFATSWSKNPAGHWHACTASGCPVTDVTQLENYAAHTFDGGTVTTPPSASSAGVRTYRCTVCGYEKTETIPATGVPAASYTITATTDGRGVITSSTGSWTVNEGGSLTATVTPNAGYRISYVLVDNASVAVSDLYAFSYRFDQVTADHTIFASFTPVSYPGVPVTPVTPVTPNPGVTAPSRPSETPDTPSTPEDPGATPSTPPANPTVHLPFVDVLASDWYNEAVKYVYEKGIMNGTDTARFSPSATTTRGMIVTILYRLEGEPGAGASTFADVPAGQWYTNAVAWAAANNIVGGYGDGRFGPNDTITREQLAAILYRYARYKGYDTIARANLSGYTDAGQISAYALEPMQWAASTGLINGVTETTLAPTGSATRAQVAAILMRFCENIAK